MKKIILWEPTFINTKKKELINDVVDYLLKKNLIYSCDEVAKAINYRESLNSTIIAHNLAAPHAKSGAIRQTILLFIKLKEGEFVTDWTENDKSIDRFIFTLIPEKCSLNDLQALKNFYIHLSKNNVMQLFCRGKKDEIRKLLWDEGD
ncbi:PTS sugar transporter subunit IIA [Liquorilactobacillus mali]|uniref:PTS EIIA type-2 domain-containing protein n=1 Tax=Liquorilactobacillus mali TaxID=1618 RepID=A0A0R2FR01_9LACO|nr:PTS sugar transporter subunit IIA [Liquorilactobacillus mali]KRN30075.1 hypothetical protein IV36_GL002327 [Liquorilactobacillus mali]MDN7144692.1 PTS sugar transporter subunit IIA [Liquorilactobacillus mali]